MSPIEFNPSLGNKAEVIQKNMRLVHSVAKRYAHRCSASVSYDDLVSEGVVGLIKAFHRFDPEGYGGAPVRFSTFAVPYIRSGIAQFLRDRGSAIRPGRKLYETAGKIYANDLTEQAPESIAEQLDIPLELVNQTLQYIQFGDAVSLDKPLNEAEESEVTLLDHVGASDDLTELIVMEFAEALPAREQAVLYMRLSGKRQREMGRLLNCSQVQVSRLLERVKVKLQSYLENPESEEWNMRNKTEGKTIGSGTVTLMDGLEWYTPELSAALPSISLNTVGMRISKEGARLLGVQAGEFVQVGFNPKLFVLAIRKTGPDKDGNRVNPASGNSGAVATNNKALGRWLIRKGIARKRYALEHDEVTGVYFLKLEKAK